MKHGTVSFITSAGLSYRITDIVFIGFILKDKEQLALLGMLNVVWVIGVSVSIGYGVGASVRIGNLLGEGDIQNARRSTVIAIVYQLFIECCLGVLTFSLAEPLSHIFTTVVSMRVQIEFGLRIVSFRIHGTENQSYCQALYIVGYVLSYYVVSWRASGYILMPAVFSLLAFYYEFFSYISTIRI